MLDPDFESKFPNLTPFEFFAIKPNFLLDAEALRTKYFEICKRFQGKNNVLVQAHKNFYQLNNDLDRLHALYQIFGIHLDAGQKAVPLEIQGLSEKLFEADSQQLPGLLKDLKSRRDDIKQSIQAKFEQLDWDGIKKLEIELSYCLRLIDSAYRLMKKEE